ncbi:MAG: trypsin-like serine protease [Luteolibacter sp.]
MTTPFFKALFISVIAALGADRSVASTILHTVDPQDYRDEALLYPSVGKVTGSGFNGSGVMLSDRWVLTAGHVSQDKQAGGIFTVGGTDYVIESTILHPGYSTSGASYSNDLGLLYLASAVTGVDAATMLHLDAPASIIGREATYVGFGYSGTGLTGAELPIELRAFTNLIEFYGDQYFLTTTSFVSDFDNPTGTSNRQDSNPVATRLEGAVTPGDSGGGVFITVGGVRYLIGINSYSGYVSAATSNSKYGGLSGAVDLQQFQSWIYSNTGIAAVPEPGTLGLCVLGSLIGLTRRRR